jgi:glycosyltransferase involved in cell wall biosynthesis
MERPLISIGMSAYNAASTVTTAIASILNQTEERWELLLVDDGSNDATLELAKRYQDPRIRILSDGRNLGLAARLNQTIDLARGEYYARVDSDDVAYPERFERQLAYLTSHRVDLLGTAAVVFRGSGDLVGMLPCKESHEQIARFPWNGFSDLMHPTWMGRLEWFRRYRYRTWCRKSQDREILLRSYRESRFACLNEPLIGYRQETLSLRKILKTRAYLALFLIQAAARQRDLRFLMGLGVQGLKMATETAAIGSGLGYSILRHRAVNVPVETAAHWRHVWSVTRSTEISALER